MCLLFEFNAYLAHTYSLFVYGWKLHHAVAPIAWGMKEHVPTLLTSYRYRIDIAISRYYRIEPEILNIESSLMNKGCQQLTITTWRPDNDSEHGVPLVVDSVPHFPVLRCHSSDSRVPSSLQYQQPCRLLTATTLHQIPTRASVGARARACVCVCERERARGRDLLHKLHYALLDLTVCYTLSRDAEVVCCHAAALLQWNDRMICRPTVASLVWLSSTEFWLACYISA